MQLTTNGHGLSRRTIQESQENARKIKSSTCKGLGYHMQGVGVSHARGWGNCTRNRFRGIFWPGRPVSSDWDPNRILFGSQLSGVAAGLTPHPTPDIPLPMPPTSPPVIPPFPGAQSVIPPFPGPPGTLPNNLRIAVLGGAPVPNQHHPLIHAELPPHEGTSGWEIGLDEPPAEYVTNPTSAGVGTSCLSSQWYTPPHIVEAARRALGGIDLDPATDRFAQETVKAARTYTYKDHGETQPWHGRVFCNPPGGRNLPGWPYSEFTRSRATAWWIHAMREGLAGRMSRLVFLAFNLEQAISVQDASRKAGVPTPFDFVGCIPSSRIAFTSYGSEGKASQPPHGSAIFGAGDPEFLAAFAREFSPWGVIIRRWAP